MQYGWTGWLFLRRSFSIRGRHNRRHKQVRGKTRVGKSYFLQSNYTQLVLQGCGASLIDPHGDLARGCVRALYDAGYFRRPDVAPDPTKKLLYINFANKEYFLPWNVLNNPHEDSYTTARNVVKAFKRVYTALEGGFAPQFEDVFFYSSFVLVENDLPLTRIRKLLTNKPYREHLLKNITDVEVIAFFHERYDRWGKDTPTMIESTLNKVSNLTKVPTLRYTFGQHENVLNFRRIMDEGVSCIFNLAGLDEDTQRMLGSFLALGFEQAALSREDILDESLRRDHYGFLDEFQMFSDTTATSINNILALAAKYHYYFTFAYQTLSQLPDETRGALQNTDTVAFREGHSDAKATAEEIGDHDPTDPKHEVEDELAKTRVHPAFFTPTESFGKWTKTLKRLHVRDAYVQMKNKTEKIKTLKQHLSQESFDMLRTMEEFYAEAVMTRKETVPTPLVEEHPLLPEHIDTGQRYISRLSG